MAETISQRVNALFASYVATEAEQTRLANLGTEEAGKRADALSAPALAIYDELFAIRDRSGCADLVAARVLLDLMLSHPWPPTSETEWGEDADVALPMLEILADRVTGAVRIETRRTLATIGVDLSEETSTDTGSHIERMSAELRVQRSRCPSEGTDEDFEARCQASGALARLIVDAEPKTPRDVALQFMADTFFGNIDEPSPWFKDRMAVLAGLDMIGPAEGEDEFLALFQRERAFQAAYAAADEIKDDDAFHRENDGEAGQILCADPPAITTPAGLRAAIAYVAEDTGYAQAAHVRILNRALAYLDGRA